MKTTPRGGPSPSRGRTPGRRAAITRRLSIGRASCILGPLKEGRTAMPIRLELRPLYPPHWRELSSRVRFELAEGRCQRCGRPHFALVRCLPDGRWFDQRAATWRDRRGQLVRWPDLVEATRFRVTRVVLAAAHLDGNPTNNRLRNLRALCQRGHMLHDRPRHLAQRWITYRRRLAVGDLFLGPYRTLIAVTSKRRPALSAEKRTDQPR
jgi:hypothetical protein